MSSVTGATLTLLLLLLPGIAFRRFYYAGEFSRQYFSEGFSQLVLRVVLLSACMQAGGYGLALARGWSGIAAAYAELTGALFGIPMTLERVRPGAFVGLQAVLTSVAASLGFLTHAVVKNYRLDVRYKLFRFQNYWHYILRGGIRGFENTDGLLGDLDEEIQYTYVDILVATSEGDMLYDGVVVDYQLSPQNQLDKLILTGTRRRRLRSDRRAEADDKCQVSRYYPVAGDFVVVPAAEIKNYNVRYVIELSLAAKASDSTIRVGDADGDVTSAAYYQTPGA